MQVRLETVVQSGNVLKPVGTLSGDGDTGELKGSAGFLLGSPRTESLVNQLVYKFYKLADTGGLPSLSPASNFAVSGAPATTVLAKKCLSM